MLIIECKEKGTSSVRNVKGIDVIECSTVAEVEDMMYFLRAGDHKYRTVSIDTMTKLQEFAIREILSEQRIDVEDKEVGFWGHMTKKQWGAVASRLRPLITAFRDLPINVVFIAHERVFNAGDDDDDEDEAILPEIGPRMIPSVADHLNAESSIIVEMFNRERERKVKIGKRTRIKRKVEYCMRIGPHAIYTTKFRKPIEVELPDVIVDPTYDKLMELVLETEE